MQGDEMMLKGIFNISRPTYGDGRRKIVISIEDEAAGVRFLEAEIDYDVFAMAITGMGHQRCDVVVKNLDLVGKVEEREKISFPIAGDMWSRTQITDEAWSEAVKDIEVDGWVVSKYLGSQNSLVSGKGKGESIVNTYKTRSRLGTFKSPTVSPHVD